MTTTTTKTKFLGTNFLISIFSLGLAVLIGIWLGVSRGAPTDEKLQMENDQLQRYVRQLQQQLTVMSAKSADLETLQKVQEQVIAELRTGNRELQNEMHDLEKDMQVYKDMVKKK
jgi:TolA-binding protein